VRHPELCADITYPGAFAKLSETPLAFNKRAPLIGEHNSDIYEKELGMSKVELALLHQSGVI
jgi:crotonobetainyl-CoA:carnitine CoA-transferase CaiB-like acyl-CoA transferase